MKIFLAAILTMVYSLGLNASNDYTKVEQIRTYNCDGELSRVNPDANFPITDEDLLTDTYFQFEARVQDFKHSDLEFDFEHYSSRIVIPNPKNLNTYLYGFMDGGMFDPAVDRGDLSFCEAYPKDEDCIGEDAVDEAVESAVLYQLYKSKNNPTSQSKIVLMLKLTNKSNSLVEYQLAIDDKDLASGIYTSYLGNLKCSK